MKRKIFSRYMSGLLYGGLILIGLNCSADRIIKSEDHDHKSRKCEDHKHELNLPFIEDWNINQKSDNEISLELRILNKNYKLEFTYADFYKREVTYNYTPGMHEYPGTRLSEGDWKLYETKTYPEHGDMISETPFANKTISFSSSNDELNIISKAKTDKKGIVKVSIKSKSPIKTIGKITSGDKSFITKAYSILTGNSNNIQTLFYGKIEALPEGSFPQVEGHTLVIYDNKFLRSNGHGPRAFDVYYIVADKVKEEKKRVEEMNAMRKEKERLDSIVYSVVGKKFGNFNAYIIDEESHSLIEGAKVSLTSDALPLRELLMQHNFPPEKLYLYDYNYIKYYPNSWNGEIWGDDVFCKSGSQHPCNFSVFKTAKHKIAITHPDYHYFENEFTPSIDGFDLDFQMVSRAIKVKEDKSNRIGRRVKH